MATPLKNGVNIRLIEYGTWMRADVYFIGGAYVFIGSVAHDWHPKEYHADVLIGHYGMERTSEGYQLLIVPENQIHHHHDWSVDLSGAREVVGG